MEIKYCSGNNMTLNADFTIKSAVTFARDISLLDTELGKVGEGSVLMILFFVRDVQVVTAFQCPCLTGCEYAPTRSANNRYGFLLFSCKNTCQLQNTVYDICDSSRVNPR